MIALHLAFYIAAGIVARAFIRLGKRFLFRDEWEMDEFRYRCGEDTSLATFLMVVFWPLCATFWFLTFLGKASFLLSVAIEKDILRMLERAKEGGRDR